MPTLSWLDGSLLVHGTLERDWSGALPRLALCQLRRSPGSCHLAKRSSAFSQGLGCCFENLRPVSRPMRVAHLQHLVEDGDHSPQDMGVDVEVLKPRK